MSNKNYPSSSNNILSTLLKKQLEQYQTLQQQIQGIPLQTISTAQMVYHTKKLAVSSAKIDAYNEIISLLNSQSEVKPL